MHITRLLIANRGEIAIRIAKAANALGIISVAIFSEDDGLALHTRRADEVRALRGIGPAAYLDQEQISRLAVESECEAVHPGYGFLSENAQFARRCSAAGLAFVGPSAEVLDLFGDKGRSRTFARDCGVPTLEGTEGATTLEEARSFFRTLEVGGSMMIKPVVGGGGRGIQVVHGLDQLAHAFARSQSEAQSVFGRGDVYVERFLPHVRHVEVQIVGDQLGGVRHLGERDCSIQRRNQKLIEIAPAPGLSDQLRSELCRAATHMARSARQDNLGTFEFLVRTSDSDAEFEYVFVESNPRLQVEHTVTEEVMGVDLVRMQLQIAAGRLLGELDLPGEEVGVPLGYAVQARVNQERIEADGTARPSVGTLSVFDVPAGRGVRVDSCGYPGYAANPRFDSLLAKVVVHSVDGDFPAVVAATYRALCEMHIEGLHTNLRFLQNVLTHPGLVGGELHTGFVDANLSVLLAEDRSHPQLYFERPADLSPSLDVPSTGARTAASDQLAQGAARDTVGASQEHTVSVDARGTVDLVAPVHGTIVGLGAGPGDFVVTGQAIVVIEAMKMEYVVATPTSGNVIAVTVSIGDNVQEGHRLASLSERDVELSGVPDEEYVDLDGIRPDLAEILVRRALANDPARPDAVARRRATGHRTARENIADLCDAGSFVEYGQLVVAGQRARHSLEKLIEISPADGFIAGLGRVNGDYFGHDAARCLVMSYDYTVFAGTQGTRSHIKHDRMFEIAQSWRVPIVFFTEGGGGRPGDTEGGEGEVVPTFYLFARLSGLVPLVGITSGRCFAGNASLLGCCDVVIATADSSIGMGGPAMIEGGGLGKYPPEAIGPMNVQVPNGVVDIAVADETEAVQVAKQYLSYFQGPVLMWECPDQRVLRHAVPENRLRLYDVRTILETIADTDSLLELRRHFGPGMITAFMRVEGRPIGVIANNPYYLAGAIDSSGADKAARFMQLCDSYDLPMLFLCDTPGIMVGPDAEKTALVRHSSRMFVTGANLSVPVLSIVLRKSYGLGGLAMAGSGNKVPMFNVAWPTGEFGGMGIEGAVSLGFRKELDAIADPGERKARFEEMVERMYRAGRALENATRFAIDDVIDPADTRRWISAALKTVPAPPIRTAKKRPYIDTW